MAIPEWYKWQNAGYFWPEKPSHAMRTRKMRNEALAGATWAERLVTVRSRRDARKRVPYLYRKLRRYVRHRAVVLHWQERTQRALCAPEGRGRAADRAAYAAELG